jgi:hypothetical protein
VLPTSATSSEEQEQIKRWAMPRIGVGTESGAYLKAVRDWRRAWRPERVRVLLVAESHVAEHSGDDAVRVHTACQPANMPDRFVRLVYCLGYGESWICNPTPAKNGGTWQFWDLFGALAGGLSNKMPGVRRKADRQLRLAWKLETLNELRARGIWLVDASVVGLYSPGGRRLVTGRAYVEVVRESFSRFVWPEVADEPLEQVWAIGRGVGDALKGLEGIDSSKIVRQPQDREQSRRLADLERMVASVRAPG